MNVIDKTVSHDIDLGVLLAVLDAQPDLPLVFKYDGRDVKAGYHVTEVKSGRFDALDCGANPESWTEIFVQLWDVDEDPGEEHDLAGSKLERESADLLRAALDEVEAPRDHFVRLGLS